ncbi:MADS-box transcription factor 1-like [Miscanthus floridulus]|uniref:MADS-box transcription factor 1-like n=1 Tax=Miscanthus floridulus TaxID=154761 RepID=UPI003458E50C
MYCEPYLHPACSFDKPSHLFLLISKINYQDYLKFRTRVEFLQTTQRNILGEDLGPLSMKELEQLENQIETSLKHIRSRENQMLLDQLFDLKSKEQELQDLNKDLRKKRQLQETIPENVPHVFCSWEEGGHSGASGNVLDPYQGLLQHPENDPSLQIGYHQQAYMDQLNNEDMADPNEHGRSGWI